MTPDVNVLVAAARSDHPHHAVARVWLISDPKAVRGLLAEVGIEECEVVAQAGARMRCAHCQAILVQSFDDLRGQKCLELLHVGIVLTEVAAAIAAASEDFKRFVFIATSPSAVSPWPHDRIDLMPATSAEPGRKEGESRMYYHTEPQ